MCFVAPSVPAEQEWWHRCSTAPTKIARIDEIPSVSSSSSSSPADAVSISFSLLVSYSDTDLFLNVKPEVPRLTEGGRLDVAVGSPFQQQIDGTEGDLEVVELEVRQEGREDRAIHHETACLQVD